MASNFDRWEKDPFFSAAEEVQESADRMESAYRTWIHERKDASSICDSDELRRDLQTALGTAKWQLEEFERAVRSSYVGSSAEDARTRHGQFIIAIENKISTVDNSLKESILAEGKSTLPWVRLDEGERDELALFLSGPSVGGVGIPATVPGRDVEEGDPQGVCKEKVCDCSKKSSHSAECSSQENNKEERLQGYRRTASASADIGAWKIDVGDEGFQGRSLDVPPDLPPPRVFSFSGFPGTLEAMPMLKWSKNGFRKWKGGDRHQAADTASSHHLSRGINECYERSKSCLDGCDDSYDKQLYGWYGAVQRQLQRSQYQIQYSRPIQVTFSVSLVLCLIVLFAWSAI